MRVADANTILRFLLKDKLVQFAEAEQIFDSKEEIFVPVEIIAEVVYVLQKVYSVSREEIKSRLIEFISYKNITLNEFDITINALKVYATANLDYADCIVYSYAKSKSSDIFSFDKGLISFFNRNNKD